LEKNVLNYENSLSRESEKKYCIILQLILKGIPCYDLDEFKSLANAANYEILDIILQKPKKIHPKYFFGPGKLKEILNKFPLYFDRINKALLESKIEKRREEDFTILINNRLNSGQILAISEFFKTKVIDRDILILEIFEQKAKTYESKLQIKLARLDLEISKKRKELSAKLKRERQGKDFKGKGYPPLYAYKSAYKKERKNILNKLNNIIQDRAIQRKKRSKEFNIAIVGYTNAGKTTFLNTIANLSLPTENSTFTTVVPIAKKYNFKDESIIFIDTVGFVEDIPNEILNAFKSTLEEAAFSDLIIIISDISDSIEIIRKKLKTTFKILYQINANNIPIIYFFNKVDKINEYELNEKKKEIIEVLGKNSLIFFMSAMKKETLVDFINIIFLIKNKKNNIKINEQ